jgi:arylsulfatase A-like enzyme/tetratricopeptide (TPR) repeat protein
VLKRGASLALLAAAAMAVVLIWRSAHDATERPPLSTRPNIVLITIDTLRADRVRRGLTPAIDAVADAGVRFDQARATVPLTLPSHVTIMTGTIPPVHGVRDNGVVFAPGPPPLARILREAGYRTAAFVGAYVLDRRFGLADGFEEYDDRVPQRPDALAELEADRRGEEVASAALAWLAGVSPPLFLWVHLYDPHAPYDPPAEYRATAGGRPYDGEVAYADAQVGRIVDALRARALLDTTIVAIAGDHGEGLGDHGERLHGLLAYDSTLRVPLVVRGPGLTPSAIASPVSLADLAPSLLRHAGLGDRVPSGASSWHLFAPQPPDRDVYAETQYPAAAGWHPLAALAGERWKLVRSSEAELYDVVADPGETRNVALERAAIAQGMAARLTRLQDQGAAPPPAGSVAPEVAERLRALGYVSGSSSPGAAGSGFGGQTEDSRAAGGGFRLPPSRKASADRRSLGGGGQAEGRRTPNPAREIAGWTRFEDALSQVKAGRAREALPALRALASRYPSSPLFQSTHARALKDAGDAASAAAVYRAAVARWPGDAALFHDLAGAAVAAGDRAEALRAERAAIAIEPDHPAAHNGLGLLHAEAGRPAEAAAAFERAANAAPSNATYWANLGNARAELGDAAAAESAYRRALASDASHPDAANGLGLLLARRGRAADAIPWFERALQRAPDFHEARLNLGAAYQQSGQPERAAATLRELLATAPPGYARERRAAAELLRQLGR